MIGHPQLVTAAIEAVAAGLSVDPEVLSVPVDLDERAVTVLAAPGLLVAKIDTDFDRVAAERRALRQLAGVLPVPEIVIATDSQPWVTGLTFLRGDPIDRCVDAEVWRQAGRYLRRIHETDSHEWARHRSHPDNVEAWIDQIADSAIADGPFSESAIKEFRRIAKNRTNKGSGAVAVHGDFRTQHVLFVDSVASGSLVSGVIDFGDAGVGDPAYDIASLTLWHPARVDDVLAGYGASSAEPPGGVELLRERLAGHRLLRLAAGAQWLHDHEFDPTPFVVGLYEELLD